MDEDVYEIIVAVGTVMKIDAEGPLPLLRLENMVSVRRMKQETLKVEVAHTADFSSALSGSSESSISCRTRSALFQLLVCALQR